MVCRLQQPGIRFSARQSPAGCVIQASGSDSLIPDTSAVFCLKLFDNQVGMHDDNEGMAPRQQ